MCEGLDTAAISNAIATSPETVFVSAPLLLVLSYGIARSGAAGFSELKNAIFANVAHGAIRTVCVLNIALNRSHMALYKGVTKYLRTFA